MAASPANSSGARRRRPACSPARWGRGRAGASRVEPLARATRAAPRVRHRREIGTLVGLAVLFVALWAATPHFATVSNLVNVVEQSAIIGIVAVGMTFVI